MFNNQIVQLKRGQFITGRRVLSNDTGISEQRIRTILKLFIHTQQINQQITNKYSIYSIVNWDQYQIPTSKQPATNQQPTTDNKDNKDNNKKRGFKKPTLNEIRALVDKRGYTINPDNFYNFYEMKNWMVGKNKMTSWPHALANWQSREKKPTTDDMVIE